MKLMASGVTCSAAIVRSPSFSRSSSSTTTIIPPARIAAMASSIDENGLRRTGRGAGFGAQAPLRRRSLDEGPASDADLVFIAGEPAPAFEHRQAHDVFSHKVALEVEGVADPGRRQGGVRPGVRDDLDVEPLVVEGGDGQADAVHRNRPLEDHPGGQIGRKPDAEAPELALRRAIDSERPDTIHVALDDVAAEPPVGPQRPFQVDRPAGRQPARAR